jgi:hypothetical protein
MGAAGSTGREPAQGIGAEPHQPSTPADRAGYRNVCDRHRRFRDRRRAARSGSKPSRVDKLGRSPGHRFRHCLRHRRSGPGGRRRALSPASAHGVGAGSVCRGQHPRCGSTRLRDDADCPGLRGAWRSGLRACRISRRQFTRAGRVPGPGARHRRCRDDGRPSHRRAVRRVRRGLAGMAIHVHLRCRAGRGRSFGRAALATARPVARTRPAWPAASGGCAPFDLAAAAADHPGDGGGFQRPDLHLPRSEPGRRLPRRHGQCGAAGIRRCLGGRQHPRRPAHRSLRCASGSSCRTGRANPGDAGRDRDHGMVGRLASTHRPGCLGPGRLDFPARSATPPDRAGT